MKFRTGWNTLQALRGHPEGLTARQVQSVRKTAISDVGRNLRKLEKLGLIHREKGKGAFLWISDCDVPAHHIPAELDDGGFFPLGWDMLLLLDSSPRTMKELARKTDRKPGNAQATLDMLMRFGLVERLRVTTPGRTGATYHAWGWIRVVEISGPFIGSRWTNPACVLRPAYGRWAYGES